MMATGRRYPEIPHFNDIEFDVLLTSNGSYVRNKEQVIFKNPLDDNDKNIIIKNLNKMNRAIAISSENYLVANGIDDDLEQYFAFDNVEVIIADKLTANTLEVATQKSKLDEIRSTLR